MPESKMRITIVVLTLLLFINSNRSNIWGFYAHKLINNMAVFTLPPELTALFKINLEELRLYAIAPDQRRHASQHEAARHYIDIDHWGTYPFSDVPRTHLDAVYKYSDILLLSSDSSDTLNLKTIPISIQSTLKDSVMKLYSKKIRFDDLRDDIINLDQAFKIVNLKSFHVFSGYDKLYFKDHLEDYGILPYHLIAYQHRLTKSFVSMDIDEIIRLAGEIGHYIADAHVPLHTTENYNGQLTNQDGLHAFWESRLPELFAEEEYNFWVGQAEYIDNKSDYFWDIVLESHKLVKSVLDVEQNLRETFPKDNQYCFSERLGFTKRLECRAYAKAYQEQMNGMVEQRMKDAIHAIGSSWYSAWVDAGSPVMGETKIKFHLSVDTSQSPLTQQQNIKIRTHNK